MTALLKAAASGQGNVVIMLVERGADAGHVADLNKGIFTWHIALPSSDCTNGWRTMLGPVTALV